MFFSSISSSFASIFSSRPFDRNAWHQSVLNVIHNPKASGREIVKALEDNSKVKHYYDKFAGVVEGYTVGEHTEMVLDLAQKYREHFEPQISQYLDWDQFLLFLALHDIGKGASLDIDRKARSLKEVELECNRQTLTWICELLSIRSSIGHIFQAMLMYDSQGDYLKGDMDAETYKKHLLEMAAVSNLPPKEFYRLYSIFHMVDAASYPNLKPLFVFSDNTIVHCEGNQSLIDYLHESL